MESRHIAIGAAAVVGAFVGTFGIGLLTSGDDAATPSSGTAPPSFEVNGVEVSASAPSAGLPDLKAKPKPKPTATPSPGAPSATVTPVPTAAPPSGATGGQGPVTGGESPVTGGGEN
jgi:hypothetical protein